MTLDLLAAGAAALGLPLTPEQLDRFATYLAVLLEWNARVNLTAITDPAAVQTRHFVDSLAVGAALLDEGAGPGAAPAVFAGGQGLIDLGTGAGFPGLPLKILWPDLPLTLVDSVGKKTAFLRAVADALGFPDVTVLTGRAEALGQERGRRAAYDVVTARAVAALPVLAEYGLPLCRVGGVTLAPKKGALDAEIAAARRALPRLGGRDLSLFRYTLPGEDEARCVVRMPKVAPTPSGYPRRVGLPAARPLGAAQDDPA
jgi:16S rRNA (guanine527-N7)-methyltransferase